MNGIGVILSRRSRLLVCPLAAVLFAFTSTAATDPALSDLGAAWFGRLRTPETRTAALREWDAAERAASKESYREGEDTPEYFAATHQSIRVLRCPQPDHPDAWLVWWRSDYHRSREILDGLLPESYPPSEGEILRRAEAEKRASQRDEAGLVWKPGEPWLESVGAVLTDAGGTILCEYNFLGCGVIADAEGDGMLDWIQFSRIHLRDKTGDVANPVRSPERLADLVSIGPIDPSAPRDAAWLCNQRTEKQSVLREGRFDIRAWDSSGGLDLFFVPRKTVETIDDPTRRAFLLRPGQVLPEETGIVALGPGDPEEVIRAFARSQYAWTKTSVGWGSDGAEEIRHGEPEPATIDSERKNFAIPAGLFELSPHEAALALVNYNRDKAHRAKYDIVIDGPPLPTVEAGWVFVEEEPGWAPSSASVWWLRGERVECWTFPTADGTSGAAVSILPGAPAAKWITILQNLDRIRTVPRQDGLAAEAHDRFGGDDHTSIAVSVGVWKPEPNLVTFESATPTLWNAIRGPYDRPVAAVLAATASEGPRLGDFKTSFEDRKWVESLDEWLDPERIGEVPPPLVRQALLFVGTQGNETIRPRLEAVLRLWGPGSAGEEELRLARAEERGATAAAWTPPYDLSDAATKRLNTAVIVRRDLEKRLASDPAAQNREIVEATLRMLEVRNDPSRLKAWADEPRDPFGDWARRRLETGTDVPVP